MLRVFAVEPSLFGEWSDFRYLHEKFGFSEARIIAAFTGKWCKMVIEATSSFREIEQAKVIEWLQNKEAFLVKSGCDYKEQNNWLLSAEEADTKDSSKFHAILACKNPRNHSKVVSAIDADFKTHDLLKCPRDCSMPKTPQGFIDACGILLKYAKQILLVDPYLDDRISYLNTIKALLSCVTTEKAVFFIRIVIDEENHMSKDGIIKKYQEELSPHIPVKCVVKLIFVEKDPDKDHNRYVLTESGGIGFPWGLASSLVEQKTDTVNLLTHDAHKKLFEDYFSLKERTIIGEATLGSAD